MGTFVVVAVEFAVVVDVGDGLKELEETMLKRQQRQLVASELLMVE